MIEAGKLTERVAFDQRIEVNPDGPNDYGTTVADWLERFTCWAEYVHLRGGARGGGEAVMAGRLAGRHTQVVRVRASSVTREVATDWRMRDVRTGVEYAVRDVTPDPDRSSIDILVESGATP